MLIRSFFVVGVVGVVGIGGCKRDVVHSDPDGGSETLARAVTARTALSTAGAVRMFPVQVAFAAFDADGGTSADIKAPAGIAGLPNGSFILTDSMTNKVLVMNKINSASFSITVIGNGTAGFADGSAANAAFNHPAGVAIGPDGTVYVADQANNRIRTISPDYKTVSTLAGTGVAGFADGLGNVAKFNQPDGISVSSDGVVYIADRGNNMIRRITSGNHVTRWAGQVQAGYVDQTGSLAAFNAPTDITITNSGAAYVVDRNNNRIRKIVAGAVTTFAGDGFFGRIDGTGTAARLQGPEGVAADSAGNLYIAEGGSATVRMITPAGVVRTILAGGGVGKQAGFDNFALFTHPRHIAVSPSGQIDMTDDGVGWVAGLGFENATKFVVAPLPNQGGAGTMTVGPDGSVFTNSSNGLLQKTNPLTGATTTLTSGLLSDAGIAVDAAGNVIVANGTVIQRVSPAGAVTTFVNVGEKVDNPCFDNAGNLFVTSSASGETVFKITPGGVVSRITAIQPVDYYQLTSDGLGKGWVRHNNPIWSYMTLNRATGNFYVGTPQTVYIMTADGRGLTPILGGIRSDIPVVAPGQELKFPNGSRLTTSDVYSDPRFTTTGLIGDARGKLWSTNSGFDEFQPPNQTKRFQMQFWSADAAGSFNFLFAGQSGTGDASGTVDGVGPVNMTFIGKPFSPALSPDGKTLYFETVSQGQTNLHKVSTSAL